MVKPRKDDEAQASSPADVDVREQLRRILASPDFSASVRVRKFLTYVVEEKLAGRADRIKAYTIAIEVFDRDGGFDAQNDPLVRIEAGHLRRALDHYYLTAGQYDAIIVSIPKGGYVPLFESTLPATPLPSVTPPPSDAAPVLPLPRHRGWTGLAWGTAVFAALVTGFLAGYKVQPSPTPEVAKRVSLDMPKLIVVPFSDLSGSDASRVYALGLTEEITSQLARFKEITVLGRETALSVVAETNRAKARRDFGAHYALEGSVRTSNDRMRFASRLIDLESNSVIWSEVYDEKLDVRDLLVLQDDIAQKVATALAQPYGAVFRADATRSQRAPEDFQAYACTLAYYSYRVELGPVQHGLVRDCLEEAVTRVPGYATAWALLAMTYLDEDRFQYNPRGTAPAAVNRAQDAAQHAVTLDPANGRAVQALMLALFFGGDTTAALAAGERALAINPNDTELLSEYGTRTALAGDWRGGAALLERALARNPGRAGYYQTQLALAAYMLRDYGRATTLIQQANLIQNPLFHLVAAAIYGQQGMHLEARAAGQRFVQMRPNFLQNLEDEFAKRNFPRVDRLQFADGLRKAGLSLPAPYSAADLGMRSPAQSPN